MALAERKQAPIYTGTRIPNPIPSVLRVDPALREEGDILEVNFGPNHPSTHATPPHRRAERRARRRRGGRHRLPPHGLREEHGAEDLVEGDHVPGADRLPLLSDQRARLRPRDREASRGRAAAEATWTRCSPSSLIILLARHRSSSSGRSRSSGTASASATPSSTSSSSSPASACTRYFQAAGSPRTSRPASSRVPEVRGHVPGPR